MVFFSECRGRSDRREVGVEELQLLLAQGDRAVLHLALQAQLVRREHRRALPAGLAWRTAVRVAVGAPPSHARGERGGRHHASTIGVVWATRGHMWAHATQVRLVQIQLHRCNLIYLYLKFDGGYIECAYNNKTKKEEHRRDPVASSCSRHLPAAPVCTHLPAAAQSTTPSGFHSYSAHWPLLQCPVAPLRRSDAPATFSLHFCRPGRAESSGKHSG